MEDGDVESLLRNFDLICQDQRDANAEILTLRSSLDHEIGRREALQLDYDDLKTDNERLKKLNMESLVNLANQFERQSKCQALKDELREMSTKLLLMKDEHAKANEILMQEYQLKIDELQKQVSCYCLKQSVDETKIEALTRDLANRDAQINSLNDTLKEVVADVESRHHHEMQDLREWLMVEQEEKNSLQKRLQNSENELLVLKAKQAEQQQDSISIRNVETLKNKVMKLRQENESLKRQLSASRSQDS